MKLCQKSTLVAILVSVIASTPGFAQRVATITLGRDPEPPYCIANPGGVEQIFWDIQHQTTPMRVYYKLEDPTRTIILEQQTYPGSTGLNINRSWTVPNGLVDGKYWVRVEYWSYQSGNEANAEVTFYVCAETGNICVTKLADTNCNGVQDPGDQPVPGYWVCIHTPAGDDYCQQTGPDGVACWSGIPLGSYQVYEPEQPGWEPIGPASYDLTLTSSEVQYVTFLNRNLELCYHACCLPNGSCTVLLETDCVAQGGTWYANPTCDGVACPQPPGACCFPDGTCQYVTEAACLQAGGQWQGMFIACDPNPCPQPPGACCFPDGTCQYVTEAACLQAGGLWQGMFFPCDPNPCIQPPGACCFPDGTCQYVTDAACLAAGGHWYGYGSVCDPNPCPQPPGACCFPDGTCTYVLQSECTGQWLGYGSLCEPNPCLQPPGACCFPDGTCTFVTQADCVAAGGQWYGYGSDCDPNPCPQPPGACCFADGTCQVLTEEACIAAGGEWYGAGVACEPENPCPPTPVERKSWGQIKSHYR